MTLHHDFVVECPPPERFSIFGGEKYHSVLDLDRGRLLWGSFCGQPRLAVGGVDLSPDFDWVPLPHFLISLNRIAAELDTDSNSDVYYFTESDDTLSFKRTGDNVAVAASYTSGIGVAPHRAMLTAVATESPRLVASVERAEPDISRHPSWPEIKEKLSLSRRRLEEAESGA